MAYQSKLNVVQNKFHVTACPCKEIVETNNVGSLLEMRSQDVIQGIGLPRSQARELQDAFPHPFVSLLFDETRFFDENSDSLTKRDHLIDEFDKPVVEARIFDVLSRRRSTPNR